MVVQTSSGNKRETDITFTIKSDDLLKTLKLIKQNKKIKYRDLIVNKKINILVIATSEIKISVLIGKKFVKKAISALHKEFKLD